MKNVECQFEYDDEVFDIRYSWGRIDGFNRDVDEETGKVYYKAKVKFNSTKSYIHYDDRSVRTLLSHRAYDSFDEVVSVDWDKRVGRWGKIEHKGVNIIARLKAYLEGRFLFEMENDKGVLELVETSKFELLNKDQVWKLGLKWKEEKEQSYDN